MKLTDNQLPAARTSGNMVTLNMGISDNAEDQLMILNVLSSTLYTDKPAAVLREYGCNAFDANVEAGKGDVPIEVGLPNKLEPSLRIRDYGFGMTEEQIANTFVKLGRSTKRNSNDFTGMLGIGSKAGFAYGDSFMVTSYTNGRKTVYNAFRDKGAPRLACMLSASTTERDGIEIKVPVRMEHFEEFRLKAERIYRYFKVRPIISGAKVEFHDALRIMSGTGWHYIGDGKSYAIMGNVGYDLDPNGMGGHTLPPKVKTLLELGVELEFNIGDLEIAASREGLQYKDITKKAVAARLDVLVKEVGDQFTKQITGAACLWDARKLYGELFERLGSSNTRSLKDIIDGQVKWNGKIVNTGRMYIENKEGDPEVNIYRVYKDRWYSGRRQHESAAQHVYASDKTTLVINDLASKKQSPSRERGFFEDPANKDKTDWVVFTFQTDAAQKRYWRARELEGAPTILMSSITPAVAPVTVGALTSPRVHNAKHSAKAFVLDEKSTIAPYGARSLFWKTESVDLDTDSGVYVELDQFYVKTPAVPLRFPQNSEEHPENFRQKVFELRKAGLIKGSIYGFKRALLSTKTLGSGWVKLEDAISTKLDDAIIKQGLLQETADYVAANNHQPIIDIKYVKAIPPGSLRDLLEHIIKLRTPKDADLMRAVLNQSTLSPWVKELKLPPPSVKLDTETTAVVKDYPALTLMPYTKNFQAPGIKNLADYIRLVESAP